MLYLLMKTLSAVTGQIILAIFNTNQESDVFLLCSDDMLDQSHIIVRFSSVSPPFLDYYRQMH